IKELFKTLLHNNVNIQLIMENQKYQQFQDTFKDIQNTFSGYSNFTIKSDKQMKTEYVHSKIDLLDSGFLIKTANLTHSSFFANREYMFYSTNSGVLQSLKTVFSKDWAGEAITSKDIHPNLVICNLNCRTVIEKLLQQAKESIIIQTQYINDPSILNILSQQQKLPELKMLVSDTDTNDTLIGYLGNYTRKLTKPYLHAKMILIDHKIILLGSMNLSANSLDMNREIGILLLDPTIIHGFTTQFSTDWNSGK
ncbi:MAG: phospholipase D-like domain-containing protein, partial [Candidatus Absconditabacterales bacterium]